MYAMREMRRCAGPSQSNRLTGHRARVLRLVRELFKMPRFYPCGQPRQACTFALSTSRRENLDTPPCRDGRRISPAQIVQKGPLLVILSEAKNLSLVVVAAPSVSQVVEKVSLLVILSPDPVGTKNLSCTKSHLSQPLAGGAYGPALEESREGIPTSPARSG